ncbi:unnamed protein product [Protopolystoma xenopodis]|uniref:Uncharacterized protein n=1 Tax=Protopolystoma xenopodis TaxID=117903 RepID=A0A448WCN0_9PLAT|nr:unnamed protein product [Protopolystoma xenopodis]
MGPLLDVSYESAIPQSPGDSHNNNHNPGDATILRLLKNELRKEVTLKREALARVEDLEVALHSRDVQLSRLTKSLRYRVEDTEAQADRLTKMRLDEMEQARETADELKDCIKRLQERVSNDKAALNEAVGFYFLF